MELPKLSDDLTRFPDCCVSISRPLLSRIASSLPRSPTLILSIGSGTGLFEALLQRHGPELNVEGVEVNDKVNRYLSNDRVDVISGTWDVSRKVSSASVLMFVYPKAPTVVKRYLAESSRLDCVVWLGPQADWDWFANEGRAFDRIEGELKPELVEGLTSSYEKLVIFRKQSANVGDDIKDL